MKKITLFEWVFYVCIGLVVILSVSTILFYEEPEPHETLMYKLGETARSLKEDFNKGYSAKDSVKIDSVNQ